jgi:two-component system, NarL family, response regulator LiaR
MHRAVGGDVALASDTIASTMGSVPERKPRVVLADDYPEVLAALGRMLEPCCEVVASVLCGVDAVEAVNRLRPDVLVTDLMMPDIDGLEVCRRVKRLVPGTAVIIITASDDAAVRTAALRDGASVFISKHLVAENLVPEIERMFADMQKRS